MSENVHQGQPRVDFGDTLGDAERIVILLHGRGATAQSMVGLAQALYVQGTRFLMPQAFQNRWYPKTAFGPVEPNEPDLSSALQVIGDLITELQASGVSQEQIVLGGFSQGACLAAEYLTRNPARLGGLFIFSGALIGPPGESRQTNEGLEGMPIFIGGSDNDPWVRKDLFHEAERILRIQGAEVFLIIYPGMGHTVNEDEIQRVKSMISGVKGLPAPLESEA